MGSSRFRLSDSSYNESIVCLHSLGENLDPVRALFLFSFDVFTVEEGI